MNLEDRIRTAIEKGGLLSVALYPSAANPGMWICAYLNDSGKSRQAVSDKDPIAALIKGITPLRQSGEKHPEIDIMDASSEGGREVYEKNLAKMKKRRRREDDDLL